MLCQQRLSQKVGRHQRWMPPILLSRPRPAEPTLGWPVLLATVSIQGLLAGSCNVLGYCVIGVSSLLTRLLFALIVSFSAALYCFLNGFCFVVCFPFKKHFIFYDFNDLLWLLFPYWFPGCFEIFSFRFCFSVFSLILVDFVCFLCSSELFPFYRLPR